jgi:hypothetical protein
VGCDGCGFFCCSQNALGAVEAEWDVHQQACGADGLFMAGIAQEGASRCVDAVPRG